MMSPGEPPGSEKVALVGGEALVGVTLYQGWRGD